MHHRSVHVLVVAPSDPFRCIQRLAGILLVVSGVLVGGALRAQTQTVGNEAADLVPVTMENFIRAETDRYFLEIAGRGALNRLVHRRDRTSIDEQIVIRTNLDTLYSVAVLDLSEPVTVTMPETDGHYMSIHVIDQDHFTKFVSTEPGVYRITLDEIGTRYAALLIRTLVDGPDVASVQDANRLQDLVQFNAGSSAILETPNWDWESLDARKAEIQQMIAQQGLPETRDMFGTRDTVDAWSHLVGTMAGWGGLPKENAVYLPVSVPNNDGIATYELTLKGTPVRAFWSVTVYNADGFLEENELQRYSFSDRTAVANADGSYTIRLGGCEDGRANCLPIMQGWGAILRMYEPMPEVIDGAWSMPSLQSL